MSEETREEIKQIIFGLTGVYLGISGMVTLFIALASIFNTFFIPFTGYSSFLLLVAYSFLCLFLAHLDLEEHNTLAFILSIPVIIVQVFILESYMKVFALALLFLLGFGAIILLVEEVLKPYKFIKKKE